MASMKASFMAPFPTETLIYQQNGHRDDISYSDRLSAAMIYKAIGMFLVGNGEERVSWALSD